MPRYYRRRYTRVLKPKKKWASNLKEFNLTLNSITSGTYFASKIIVSNTQQTSTPTPVVLKCGNFKVQGDSYIQAGSGTATAASITVYVLYLPEDIDFPTSDREEFIRKHPEWILAWKFISANYVNAGLVGNDNSFTFSSRLKRNLNSGDRVVLCVAAAGSNVNTVVARGQVQFWTCSN